ncbi:MAG: glycerol kinase GlpK [Gemmatimonadales bacterium]|nr:glycerol kinase GlpK [Gemmatimonadales bacterium]MDZ4389559.1 glycerol kinase GlpK [Gemmatimonadales bacterium]
MPTILALDQGTTGSTALVFGPDGTVLGRGYREIAQHYPAPGQVEHDPEELFQSIVAAAREALAAHGGPVDAIGITNQRETLVLWDRDTLRPIGRAIVWQDRRTAERCAELRAAGHEPWLRARTGLLLDPYFSATKLESLLAEPAIRDRAEAGSLAVGTVESWLVARLTGGVHVSDRTNASRTMLTDIATGDWHPELLEFFRVPADILPRVVPSSGVVGEAAAEWFGSAIPIAGLVGDQQGALFGQGCVVPGSAKITYGTGAFLLRYTGSDAPPVPDQGILATLAAAADGGRGWALEGSVFIAGAAVQWLRDGLGIIGSAAETAELAASVPDTGGVVMVPAFTGLGAPHWEARARGTLVGLSRGTTRAHLVRATLEAIAHGTCDLVEAMGGVRTLRVDGGAAANDWLMQIQADLLGVSIERPVGVELTAYGAARLAAIGIGETLPPAPDLGAMTVFEPQQGAEWREKQRAEWRRAVGAALAWAEDGERGARG